jgi:hypothetical protein
LIAPSRTPASRPTACPSRYTSPVLWTTSRFPSARKCAPLLLDLLDRFATPCNQEYRPQTNPFVSLPSMRRYLQTLLLNCALLVFGCQHSQRSGQTTEIRDNQEMQEKLVALIPHGTAIEQAKRLMENEGFVCAYEKNETFISHDESRFANRTFLLCDRYDTQPRSWVSRRWQIALMEQDERVVGVAVSSGLLGP